jgi:hypothetical protein
MGLFAAYVDLIVQLAIWRHIHALHAYTDFRLKMVYADVI